MRSSPSSSFPIEALLLSKAFVGILISVKECLGFSSFIGNPKQLLLCFYTRESAFHHISQGVCARVSEFFPSSSSRKTKMFAVISNTNVLLLRASSTTTICNDKAMKMKKQKKTTTSFSSSSSDDEKATKTTTKATTAMLSASLSLAMLFSSQNPAALLLSSDGSMIEPSPGVAFAGGLNKKGNNNAYEEMMRQMEEQNKNNGGGGGMSAESLFKESGGACGPGYEMKVKLVTGAECECVQPELCTREGEMTAEERSYGKKPKPVEGEEAKKEMMSSDGGIQFTFNN